MDDQVVHAKGSGEPAAAQALATDVEIRVRYAECDAQNVAHHSVYPVWLEIARTELLRKFGVAYRDLEAAGVLFVVVDLSIRFRRPALYDDVVRVHVTESRRTRVKIEHTYAVYRGQELLASAQTTLACVNREGRVQAIPEGALHS